MGKIRTSEDLEKLFKENRERREKKLQVERDKKKKQRQEEYKQLSKLADELLRRDKEKKMEELQALAKKCSQKASNEATEPLKVYKSKMVEREPNDRDLYQTREDLQRWEEKHWKCINWDKWDELVKKAREENNSVKVAPQEKLSKSYGKIKVYIYDRMLKFMGEFESVNKAAKELGMGDGSIRHLLETGQPHKKLGITVLDFKLTEYD